MKTALLVLALLIGAGSRAQPTIDYRAYLHQSGFRGIHAQNVTIDDGCLYLATFNGMRCFSLADDGSFVALGSVDFPFGAAAIAVADGFAYAVTGDYYFETFALTVIDVTDPTEPTIVGVADLPLPSADVAVSGDRVLVACGGAGVLAFDVGDPAAPVGLGSIPISFVSGVATSGSWGFAVADDGLHVLDLTAPGLPEPAGSVAIPGGGITVAVTDLTAHVVGSQGLYVVDCADPWQPTRQGDAAISGLVRQVAVENGIAYVAIRDRGLKVFDVADPWQPRPIGGILSYRNTLGVAVADATVYLVCFDWATSEQPGCGIKIIDATNPASPPAVGELDLGVTAHDLCVSGHLAYVITDHGQEPVDLLQVVDVAQPEQPRLVATATLPDGAVEVATVPDHVVVGYGAGNLLVVDVTDLQAITPVGEIQLSAELNTFVTAGSYAYAGVGYYIWGAIQGVDLTDPAHPQIHFQTAFGGPGTMGTDGTHLIVAGLHGEIHPQVMLVTFDISDPPQVHGGGVLYFEDEDPYYVDVAGDRVVMTGSLGGYEFPWPHLRCIDISVPEAPQSRGALALERWSGGVALDTDVAYVGIGGEDHGALQVYSASDLTQPWLVGGTETDGALHALTVSDALVYGLVRPSTLVILPTQIGGTTAVEGGFEGPAGSGLGLAIHPNPFNPKTTIQYKLSVSGPVRLQIFDLRGRLVTDLVDETVSAGQHEVTWYGRDSNGREVPSGVYVSRLEAGSQVAYGRMTLVR